MRMVWAPWRGWLAAAVIVGVLGALAPRVKVLPLTQFDQQFYLGMANDLLERGVFTDGYLHSGFDPNRGPGMHFVPLYPAFLAMAAKLDSGFAASLACVAGSEGKRQDCPQAAPLPRAAQFAMMCCVFWLAWWSASRAGGARVGWVALGLALACAPFLLRIVPTLMTEAMTLFFTTVATACAVAATKGRRPGPWVFAAGVAVALAALTRPSFQFLVPFGALAGLALGWRTPAVAARLAGLFVLGAGLTLAPWLWRNFSVLGHLALTHGYDSHTLAQRISFNAMTWGQWGQSFLCWLPDGSGIAGAIWGKGVCTVFMWEENPHTFYMIGQTTFLHATLAAAGGWDAHLGYLLRNYVFAQPLWHAAVTVSMALRGGYLDHWWGVLLLPVCAWATWRALRAGDMARLAILLPGWFMLGLHAAVAVNQERYNLMLFLPYAFAGGLAAEAWFTRRAEGRKAAQ